MSKKIIVISLLASMMYLGGCADKSKTNPVATKIESLQQQYETVKQYNSFLEIDFDNVKNQAKALDAQPIKGALHGLTIAVKDNIDALPYHTTAGTKAFAGYKPTKNASTVQRLVDQGALMVGKTNMHELAFGITNINASYGTAHNAINFDYIAGGSSGGTAVAVALGLVDAGLGSDTGGSGRIPAAFNGVVGFRPTTGRYANDGLVPISPTRDTVTIMAKTVDLVRTLDAVLSGTKPSSKKFKPEEISSITIGIPRNYFYESLTPEVSQNIELAIAILKRLGAKIVEAPLPGVGELNEKISFPIVLFESGKGFNELLATYAPNLTNPKDFLNNVQSPDVRATYEKFIIPHGIPESVYTDAIANKRPELQALYKKYFEEHKIDIILIPVTPSQTIPIAGNEEQFKLNGKMVPTFQTMIKNMDPSSNAGIPGIAIPFGKTLTGIPIGIELESFEGNDEYLLAVAELILSLLQKESTP
ncbi:MAG: amidase family protein [Methylacidiphilales bacterium]|nr:amidase family protein [Candidatus Methylacidiphilales bacterium]